MYTLHFKCIVKKKKLCNKGWVVRSDKNTATQKKPSSYVFVLIKMKTTRRQWQKQDVNLNWNLHCNREIISVDDHHHQQQLKYLWFWKSLLFSSPSTSSSLSLSPSLRISFLHSFSLFHSAIIKTCWKPNFNGKRKHE